MNLFFDTSALVKIFHDEKCSQDIRNIYNDDNNTSYILDVAQIEYYSALYRRYRNKEISKNQLKIALTGFDKELVYIRIQYTTSLIIDEARTLLALYGEGMGLRTLDSLHLAAFSLIHESDWIFVCCDNTLSDIAAFAGYHVYNPLNNNSIPES